MLKTCLTFGGLIVCQKQYFCEPTMADPFFKHGRWSVDSGGVERRREHRPLKSRSSSNAIQLLFLPRAPDDMDPCPICRINSGFSRQKESETVPTVDVLPDELNPVRWKGCD
ncbi:hypothetical protein BJX61DRAFT_519831, partial [Aspergillus egyptiacus]